MRYLVEYFLIEDFYDIPNTGGAFGNTIIANSSLIKCKHKWKNSSEIPSVTFGANNYYQQLKPILGTNLEYFSKEDPVSVDSFTSSDDDSTSTVILLKSSVEVNVDAPDSHDHNLPSLSRLQALPDFDYRLYREQEDVIIPKYGKSDEVEYMSNKSSARERPNNSFKNSSSDFNKTCKVKNSTDNRKTFSDQSINVNCKGEKIYKLPNNDCHTNAVGAALSKGKFITDMTFV